MLCNMTKSAFFVLWVCSTIEQNNDFVHFYYKGIKRNINARKAVQCINTTDSRNARVARLRGLESN